MKELSISKLKQYAIDYDKLYGDYRESCNEGENVYDFIIAKLYIEKNNIKCTCTDEEVDGWLCEPDEVSGCACGCVYCSLLMGDGIDKEIFAKELIEFEKELINYSEEGE